MGNEWLLPSICELLLTAWVTCWIRPWFGYDESYGFKVDEVMIDDAFYDFCVYTCILKMDP
jgi:hypothetical protein